MNNLYMAKERGKLENGVSYVILQDGPRSFHVTVTNSDLHYYEHFSPNSIEELRNGIQTLSDELLASYNKDLTNTEEVISLPSVPQLTEQTNTEEKDEQA
jgi:hypothetical protein